MENYGEMYDRLKKDGVKIPFTFVNKEKVEEEFRYVSSKHVPDIRDENRYLISNHGNVIDTFKSDEPVDQYTRKGGYKAVNIAMKNRTITIPVHRLEMLAFDYNPDYKNLQVNHKDGNPSNNMINNLEWTTPKENSDHAMLFGLHKMHGEDNPNNKLTENQVEEICELIQSGKYFDTEIAEMYGVSYANISDIHKGKIWNRISRNYDLSPRKPRALNDDQIREICKMLETSKYSDAEIGRKFNVSCVNIRLIRNRKIHTDISKDYNFNSKSVPKKFTKDQIREMCEIMQTGQYYDSEIAKMFNTTSTHIYSLRTGKVHTDITKDYDMTIVKNPNLHRSKLK